jgi:predicted Zn-dependent protease with MMP-like domain
LDLADQIEAIRARLDGGDPVGALNQSRKLASESPQDPAAALVHAEAAWANDAVGECRKAASDAIAIVGSSGVDPAPEFRAQALYWLARVAWRHWRFAEAEEELRKALELTPRNPFLWEMLAEILERTGRSREAESADARAEDLDPEQFPPPTRFSRQQAEEALREALDALPEEFENAAGEVPIVLERFPTLRMARAESPDELPLPPDILGLYAGVSLADRSFFHAFEPPGTILLFQGNLERMCADRETLIEEITITLEHELAHYLGFDESAMEDLGLE